MLLPVNSELRYAASCSPRCYCTTFFALLLFRRTALVCGLFAGCSNTNQSGTPDDNSNTTPQQNTTDKPADPTPAATPAEKVHITLFTGKIETIDVMNEIIDAFNASQDRIEVEQEY